MLPFELTKDTPYLALSGELWSVFYEYFNRNWPCYKGFLLYRHEETQQQHKEDNKTECTYDGPHCKYRDHSPYGLSQWETTLYCNVASYWLSIYPKWSPKYKVIPGAVRCLRNSVVGWMPERKNMWPIALASSWLWRESLQDWKKHQQANL